MYTFFQHKVVRAAGMVIAVAIGFLMWLLAHDAIAKPTREQTFAAQARSPGGVRITRVDRAKLATRIEVVRNMAMAIASARRDTMPEPALGAAKGAAASHGTVNLNTATIDELQRLPGIGPSKAAMIIAWRQRHREFRRVVDLRRVKGIGYKTFKKLEPFLAVSGATTLRGR